MRNELLFFAGTALVSIVAATSAGAQVAAPSGQKTLAATLEVYVFPKSGQNAEQQSRDEGECYGWAVENTGTDPFEMAKQAEAIAQQGQQAQAQAAQAGAGAGARGVIGGAAVGALVGEIASNDPGKGAVIGAAAGGLAGRGRRKAAQGQAQAQAAAQTQQGLAYTAQQVENFKKAFSVCLEAKEYLVKF